MVYSANLATSLFRAIAHAYAETIADARVEYNAPMAQQLSALHAILVDQAGNVAPYSDITARPVPDLRLSA